MLKLRNSIGINIPFGIEIEFSKLNLDVVRNILNKLYDDKKISESLYKNSRYNKWQVKSDKSVTDTIGTSEFGGELISPILIDNPNAWHDIDMLCNILKNNDAKIYDCDAGHIHISGSILENDVKKIYNLFKLWVAFEDIIFKFSYNGPEARDGIFIFAAPIYKIFFEYKNSLEQAYSIHDLTRLDFSDRNYALNFENFINAYNRKTDKDTIEIRCPNGTLDATVWQNNINFFTKLIYYAVSNEFDKEIVNYYIKNNNYPSLLFEAFNVYSLTNTEKAKVLSNLIFTSNIDKEYFMEQYTKKLKTNFII